MTLSKELLEMLAEFEKRSPMKVVTVSNEEEFDAAVSKMTEDGLRLACVSNAGLPDPLRRLTFLPESAFTETPEPREKREPVDLREWVKQFD